MSDEVVSIEQLGAGAGAGLDAYVLDKTGTTPVDDPKLRFTTLTFPRPCDAGAKCGSVIAMGELAIVKLQLVTMGWRTELKESVFHEDCFFNLMVPRARSWSIKSGAAIKGFSKLSASDAARIETRIVGAAAGQKALLDRADKSRAKKVLVDRAKSEYACAVSAAIAAGAPVPAKPKRWVAPAKKAAKTKRAELDDDDDDEIEERACYARERMSARALRPANSPLPLYLASLALYLHVEPKKKKAKAKKALKVAKEEESVVEDAVDVAEPEAAPVKTKLKTKAPKKAKTVKAAVAVVVAPPAAVKKRGSKAKERKYVDVAPALEPAPAVTKRKSKVATAEVSPKAKAKASKASKKKGGKKSKK
jgi:hypothetical protein